MNIRCGNCKFIGICNSKHDISDKPCILENLDILFVLYLGLRLFRRLIDDEFK